MASFGYYLIHIYVTRIVEIVQCRHLVGLAQSICKQDQ